MDNQMDSLFPQVDRDRTVENCKHFLGSVFPRMLRASGLTSTNYDAMIAELRSPAMDGMPKSPSKLNNADATIIRRAYAQQIVERTVEAIGRCDRIGKELLSMRYLNNYTDTMCYMSIGYSRSHYFEHIKPSALLQFADTYLLDDLHIYKSDSNRTKSGL